MTLRSMRRWLRALFGGRAIDREVGDEVGFHLEMETEDLMRTRGLSRDEARRRARVRFGGVDRHTESHRDARGVRWAEDLAGDIRYATRALRRAPTFAVSAILVLGLGIGTSTAIFSAVNRVVLARLPYKDDQQLVRIFNENSATNRWSLSVADVQAIQSMQRSFSDFGALATSEAPVSTGRGEAVRAHYARVTAGVFGTLGVRAAAGRVIDAADESPSARPVAVVSSAFATQNFGSPRAALGRTFDLDGAPRAIVGVLPAGIGDLAGVHADIWSSYQMATPKRRGPFGIAGVARLKPGISMAAAAADLSSISKRIFPIWQSGFADSTARFATISLREAMVRDAPKTLWMYTAAALLLLLTAITNVANLMLARLAARTRELSLRLTLGASRGRIARLVVAESTLVAAVGAAVGLVAGSLMLKAIVIINSGMPRLDGATIDARSVAFALGVAALTALLVGAYPVVALLRGDKTLSSIGSQREIGGLHGSRMRGALVAAEFALALPLLAAAGQLVQSLSKLEHEDPGFDASQVAYARVVLPSVQYDSAPRVNAFWQRAEREVAAMPGAVAAGYSTEVPPADVNLTNNFRLEGTPSTGGPEATSPWMAVSPGYFDALGMKLLAGRMFNADDAGPTSALIVSQSWANRYSPDRPVVGRRVFSGGCTASGCAPEYVVGVVSNAKYEGLSGGSETAYTPAIAGMSRSGFMFVRARGPPSSVLPALQATLRRVDASAPVDEVAALEDHLYETTAAPRHWAMLIGAFAIAALVLAAVGIFGLLSYLVTTMQREIGVRVALGAQRREIATMVIRRGLVNSSVGVAAGWVIAAGGRQLVAASLYKATPGDPAVLGATTIVLLVVAALGCLAPAARAANVDAMTAIRADAG